MNLEEQLIRHEGLELKPYVCTGGKLTIGVGLNLEDGITREEALYLLWSRIGQCIRDLQTFRWWYHLDEARRNALIDLRYNLGPTRFRGFKRMLAALEAHDWPQAAAEMRDSKWAREDVQPERSERLIRMMETGELP